MRIDDHKLEASWEMIYEETLLDVAAAIAATEPSNATEHEKKTATATEKPAPLHSAFSLRWAVRVPAGIN